MARKATPVVSKTNVDLNVGGVKHDIGKNPLDLLPFGALEDVGRVLEFGAKKYSAWNWSKGMVYSRLIAASLRHIFAFAKGENNDPETGISHIAHALCCLLFLQEYINRGGDFTKFDDRYIWPKQESEET